MKLNYICCLFLIYACEYSISTSSHSSAENIFNIEQDVAIEVEDDDGTIHYMEVFKSNLNDKIIQEKNNNQQELSKLKWYSLGIPTLVENKLYNKSLINFHSNGFYISIQMLTDSYRAKIIEAIRNKYNIDVKNYQIDNIIANEYKCHIEITCADLNRVKFFGSVNDFLKFPLRVDFKIDPTANKHRSCLNEKLKSRDENDEIIFHCTLTTLSKNEKINFLKVDASIYDKMNIEDDLFGNSDWVYLSRHQLGNLASTLYFSLNVYEEYQIEKHEFGQEFIENFISQITKKSFDRIQIDDALSYLSKYSTRDFEPDTLSSELKKVLIVKNNSYISVREDLADENKALFQPLDINSTINIVNKKENAWKTDSSKSLNDQLIELNKESQNEIEWKLDENRIIPKSLKVSKLIRNQFKKSISFNRIFKKEYEKTFVRSFDLYSSKKKIEMNLNNEELIEKKFEKVYKNVSDLLKKFEMEMNEKLENMLDKLTWNVNYGPIRKKLNGGHASDIETMVVLSNGDLATGSDDTTIVIWNLDDGTIKRRLKGHTEKVRSLIVLKDGDLVSASFDLSIIVWDTDDGSIKRKLTAHSDKIRTIILLKNDDLASGSDDRTIIIWDSKDWSIRKKLTGHSSGIYSLLTLPNGDLVSGAKDGSIFIWNTTDSKIKKRITDYHKNMIRSLVMLPNGEEMISASEESSVLFSWDSNEYNILIWDINDFTLKKKYKVNRLRSLVVLPNGHFAVGSYDKSISILSQNDELPTRKLTEHNGCVNTMTVLPNGNLVSGSNDRYVIIWNLVYIH